MSDIRIIFFDIDGTLVDHATGRVSEKTTQALQLLRQRGIVLCLATGRAPCSLPPLEGLEFDAFCTFNGSLCYTPTETIFRNPIAPRDVNQVLHNAAALGRPVALALRDRLSANGIGQDLADYYRLANLELTADPEFHRAPEEDVYQILVGCREAEHPALIQDAPGVKLAISWDRAVDVIPTGSGKGFAIEKILEYFGLRPEQALAFGDGHNDLEMLQAVGTGVAMGNAAQVLKNVADEVCLPVSQDGIYHYCIEQGLI